MRVAVRSQLTPQEYLAWEREQTDKHEYHLGEVFPRAGCSPRRTWLAGNVRGILKRELDARCFTFTSDQRIVFDDGKRYIYPDATVVCGSITLAEGTRDVITNPTILLEILASTAPSDRGLPWEDLRRLASLTDYLLVAQHEIRIEHHQQAPDRGWRSRAHGAGEHILLANGAQLTVDAVYARAFELPTDVAVTPTATTA